MITRRAISAPEAKRISAAVKARWAARRSADSDPQEKFWHPLLLEGRETSAGESVSEKNSLQCMAVWACVKCISDDIAKIPMYLYQRNNSGKTKVFNRISNLFLQSANPEMSAFDFERTLTAHVCGWGNGYAEIEFDNSGMPLALWPLPPSIVQAKRDENTRELYYEVRVNPASPVRVPAWKMFHIKGLGFDGIIGYSPVQMHRETIGLSLAQQKFGSTFYGNGAYPGVMLSHPARLSVDAQNRLRKSWDEILRSADKAHRTIILEEGMKPERMTINPDDAQYLEGRQFSIEDIARMYRVPPHKIQHLLRSTNNNIESQNTEYATDCLHAYAISWETEAVRKLFPAMSEEERAKVFFRHDFTELLRGDSAARSAYYMNLRNIGAINGNEIREKEDLDPMPNGDAYLVQGAMTTIDRVITGENFGAKPESAPPPDKTKEQKAAALSRIAENHEILLTEVFTRALKIESERVSKAAKKPDFDKFKDEFYKTHTDSILCGIRFIIASYCETGAALGLAAVDSGVKAVKYSAGHCMRSQENLTPATVEAAVLGWNEARARNYAADIIRELTSELLK